MLWLVYNGGFIILLLAGLSIAAATIAIQKFSRFRKSLIEQRSFFDKITSLLEEKQLKKALSYCREQSAPFARVMKEGLKKVGYSREEIKSIVQDRADVEMQEYEKGLGILGNIAHISPLLGLLGTVIGMIHAFMDVQATTGAGSPVRPADLSKGIWQALLTTAAGLTVAIIVYLAHNYLLSLRDRLFTEFEDRSIQTIGRLSRFRRVSSGDRDDASPDSSGTAESSDDSQSRSDREESPDKEPTPSGRESS